MKLLNADEMRDIDRRATEEYGIPSILLMENAGLRIVELIEDLGRGVKGLHVVILAGRGNNGGDGLVAARHLINGGAKVDTFLLGDSQELTQDSGINYDMLGRVKAGIYPLRQEEDLDKLMVSLLSADVIIDAIYGIGFHGSLGEFETQVAKLVNWSQATVISADIPSGVEADTGKIHGEAIRADYTVTFALPKVGLVLDPGKEYAGTLTVADISIPRVLLSDPRVSTHLIDGPMVQHHFAPRRSETHKGTFGHALIIGGSAGMTGAVIMSAYAALRAGAGLVTTAVPESLLSLVDTTVLEIMTRPLPQTRGAAISLEALPAIENLLGTSSVCAIGPGMSRYPEANAILRFVLKNSGIPVIIDADGINALQGDASILKDRQVPVVLTPHPGEMARLTGLSAEAIQQNRLEIARRYALLWGITLVLKGNKTVIASPNGELFVNICGNPGMATAGSGDVLTGIIAGLIAQGLKPLDAAVAGVYLHGMAGDQVVLKTGERGLVAGDLIQAIPDILCDLEEF
ncbi:MAG: NAD(P)H-hydrate dehydratase [Bacillota bacterium]|nr:NAD(P)H-hydrate dehydratase [Bacillota bacterium]